MALGFSCWVTVAHAASPPARQAEPFRLVWSSSAGCGDARIFLAELKSRTALLREAHDDEHAITLVVETFRTKPGVRGQLTVRKPDGDLTVREVPGHDCQEVAAAMALIAALMVDPLAAGSERTGAKPSFTPVARQGGSTASAQESPWSLRLEPRLTARTAVAPGLAWGQAWGVMLTREAAGFRPALGLSGQVARATASAPQGSAELEWAVAQLVLCPTAFQPGGGWDLRACGAFQLGRLRGTGFQTVAAATKAILWSSAGVELQARYQLLGPLWLGGEGAMVLPFTRERFYLEPQSTLHRVPAWGLSVGVGLGLRFF